MIASEPIPDAVRIPKSFAGRGNAWERSDAICALAESLLAAPRSGAFVRKLREGKVAIYYGTRSPEDTLNYPQGHPRMGRPRYRWDRRADGVELGYLLPDPHAQDQDPR